LIELEAQSGSRKSKRGRRGEEEPEKKFTVKSLSDCFSQLKSHASFEAMDHHVERFTKVERIIQDAVLCYREKDEEKKQSFQTKLSMFLIKKTSTSTQEHDPDDPQPSTSND
jgi:hypothetical protein